MLSTNCYIFAELLRYVLASFPQSDTVVRKVSCSLRSSEKSGLNCCSVMEDRHIATQVIKPVKRYPSRYHATSSRVV